MKFLKIFFLLISTLSLLFLFSACGESNTTSSKDTQSVEQMDKTNPGHEHGGEGAHNHDHEHPHSGDATLHGEGKAYTAAYVCPMHCEGSGSEQAGECPVCGMAYVAQSEHVADGHGHE